MEIIHWLFFAISVIGFLLSSLFCIFGYKENEESETFFSFSCNLISVGLMVYSSFNIISSTIASVLFGFSLTVSFICGMLSFIKSFKDDFPAFFKVFFAATILLLVIIFVLSVGGVKFTSIELSFPSFFFNNNLGGYGIFAIIFLSCFIGLFCLLLLLYRKSKRIDNKCNELVVYQNTRDRNEGVINRADLIKLYDIYQRILTKAVHLDNDEYLREMLSFYLDDLNIPIFFKKHALFTILQLLQVHNNISFSEFQDLLTSSDSSNSKSKLDNNYIIEEIVMRTQLIIKGEIKRLVLNDQSKEFDRINERLHDIKELVSENIKMALGKESLESNVDVDLNQIRELFHSLMTPISLIEASNAIVLEKVNKNDDVLMESAKAIEKGVSLLYAFLYAYRQVATVAIANDTNDKLTIKNGIDYAKSVYQLNYKKSIIFHDTNLPETIKGFSSSFILASFLPLLENAIFATNNDQVIDVEYKKELNDHLFIIKNPINGPIELDKLYQDGYSSKMENGEVHKGMGLSAVRNLIKNVDGSMLKFNLSDSILETILTIHISE